ncbi:hypothetical protein L1987_20838 [Smallanthus sonchifolius]|uniref:Uncharacterized protein n=1 Tax=Smallanthus sonchifolius TaxID=185202 RepID=A0ACB9IUF3_9ASTR|nr:hypothetical protein L1987_20838 [Smallanthus sonchifolius]
MVDKRRQVDFFRFCGTLGGDGVVVVLRRPVSVVPCAKVSVITTFCYFYWAQTSSLFLILKQTFRDVIKQISVVTTHRDS